MDKVELKKRIVAAVYGLEDAAESWKETQLNDFAEEYEMDQADNDLMYARNSLFELFAELTGIDMSDELDYDYHEDSEDDEDDEDEEDED